MNDLTVKNTQVKLNKKSEKTGWWTKQGRFLLDWNQCPEMGKGVQAWRFWGRGGFWYTEQNPDHQNCRFPVQFGAMIFPNAKEVFSVKNSDGQCIQKSKEREFTCETYLDVVDDLINDEECHFLDQMNISGVDLDGVKLQPVTLASPSICQTRENQLVRQTNRICSIKEVREMKNHQERITPWNRTPKSQNRVSYLTNAPSSSTPPSTCRWMGTRKIQDLSRNKLSAERKQFQSSNH